LTEDKNIFPTFTPAELALFQERNPDVKALFRIAERIWARPITYNDMNLILGFFDHLCMSADLVEFLINYCAENGHTDFRYIKKTGLNWHNDGIVTAEDAREQQRLFNHDYREVMRAFGKQNDTPNRTQAGYIKKWRIEWGIALADVVSACERAYENTGKMSFAYADRIIEGLKNESAKKPDKPPEQKTQKGRNRFANFEERKDIDFDELERKERELLMKRFGDRKD